MQTNRETIHPPTLVIFQINYPYIVWDCPELCKTIVGERISDFARKEQIDWFGEARNFQEITAHCMKETKMLYKTMTDAVEVFTTIDQDGWRMVRIAHPKLRRRFSGSRSEGGMIYAKVCAAIQKEFGELLYIITI